MLTVRAAAHLLQSAGDVHSLLPIASACGFGDEPIALDDAHIASLGLPGMLGRVHAAAGGDSLRVLLGEINSDSTVRDVATIVARALARNASHLLWLVALTHTSRAEVAVIAWGRGRRLPRVVALHAERRHVVDSDAETLSALAAVHEQDDLARHARWLEILGREALSRRFYGTLQSVVDEMAENAPGGAPPGIRRELALLNTSRLLFLAFLQAKGWLDGDRDFLSRLFADAMLSGGSYHWRVLRPLFFGTLNTPPSRRAPAARAFGRVPFLNGGLFSRTPLEKRWRAIRFDDASLGRLHGDLFARYRFTAREESSAWSEAAVDPEMLGHAFESLMAGADRKSSGAFYTPQRLVERLTSDALDAVIGETPSLERVQSLRVLDPACGSGAFLVHALERCAAMRAALGDSGGTADLRRDVLVRGIFGVDVNPTAVWLCELRLWLSVVIDSEVVDPLAVTPLPNLDRNVRVGDALSGDDFIVAAIGDGRAVQRLRLRYVRAAGARKRTVLAALEREERRLAVRTLERELSVVVAQRRDRLAELRARDLWGTRPSANARARAELADLRNRARALAAARATLAGGGALPFSFATHFTDAASAGGFDIVTGNPPWVRVHRIPERQRVSLKRRFAVFRDAAWIAGAQAAHAGAGFATQIDLASLFVERSLHLLKMGGALALLLPSKVLRTLAGGGVRRLLTEQGQLLAVTDYSAGVSLFDAAVYPAAVVASRSAEARPMEAIVHHRGGAVRWTTTAASLAFDDTPGSPFLLAPPEVRAVFDAIGARGRSLATSAFGRPTLGVKTGCNDAFIISAEGRNGVPAELLRPVLRGESLRQWRAETTGDVIVWTHGGDGRVLPALPASLATHLSPWRGRLGARTDLRGGERWWTLFRTDGASGQHHRVVWADMARAPRAALLARGDRTVPLNSCYVVSCEEEQDALALCALLNSPLAAAWLSLIAEPARGGYRRFLGWTVSLLPIPSPWGAARDSLADVARLAIEGRAIPDDDLLAVAAAAYGLMVSDVQSLVTWSRQ